MHAHRSVKLMSWARESGGRSQLMQDPRSNKPALLWMDGTLHHFETMGNECSLGIYRGIINPHFSGGAGFRPCQDYSGGVPSKTDASPLKGTPLQINQGLICLST